jgi:hypothetical protein
VTAQFREGVAIPTDEGCVSANGGEGFLCSLPSQIQPGAGGCEKAVHVINGLAAAIIAVLQTHIKAKFPSGPARSHQPINQAPDPSIAPSPSLPHRSSTRVSLPPSQAAAIVNCTSHAAAQACPRQTPSHLALRLSLSPPKASACRCCTPAAVR